MSINVKTSKIVYSFFGAPGSGKGTLAEKCVNNLGYLSLSTGNLVRKHILEKTALGLKIESIINSGNLVSDDIISEMVNEWLIDSLKKNSNAILDGYPRTLEQAKIFEVFKKSLPEEEQFDFYLIFFDLDEKEILRRLSNRLVCSNKKCQKVYSTILNKPKIDNQCDFCHHKLIKRTDDSEEVVFERLKIFNQNKNQILDFYNRIENGRKIIKLDVDRKSPEALFNEFIKIVENIKKSLVPND